MTIFGGDPDPDRRISGEINCNLAGKVDTEARELVWKSDHGYFAVQSTSVHGGSLCPHLVESHSAGHQRRFDVQALGWPIHPDIKT